MTAALVVTDHALMRYMARILGIDIEDMRRQVAASLADLNGSGCKYATRNGVTFVMGIGADGTTVVKTVLSREQHAANKHQRFSQGKQGVRGR